MKSTAILNFHKNNMLSFSVFSLFKFSEIVTSTKFVYCTHTGCTYNRITVNYEMRFHLCDQVRFLMLLI